MRVGQTSAIYFLSSIFASVLGFVATIYFARLLGADPLGTYYLVIGVVSWLAIVGQIGVSGAVTKRVSEGQEQEQYAVAGIILIVVLFITVSIGLIFSRSYVDGYLGYPATGYVVLILLVTLMWSIISSLLSGLHLVHLKGLLSPVKTGGQSLLQIGAVAAGFGLTGLFLGYVVGFAFVILIGAAVVFVRLDGIKLPEMSHYRSLYDYGKFSWLGNLESRMFNYTDVIVLGFFVPSALIGIYSIAWNVAMFLIIFSGSISKSFFPEMSERSANSDPQMVVSLVEDSLSFTGLILIPGLVGGVILGEYILRIFGDEFTQGTAVLAILILASLVRAYQKQLLNALNAIDRPDLSFRANALFVVVNLSLNIALIYLYGWLGAAVATVLSIAVSFVVANQYLTSIIDFRFPYAEISRQWLAAVTMGSIVYGGLQLENAHRVIGHNAAMVTFLICLGAGIYFLVLLVISPQFRQTVDRNIPIDIPLLSP